MTKPIERMLRLQELDLQRHECATRRAQVPARLEETSRALEKAQRELEETLSRIKSLRSKADMMELDRKSKEEKITKLDMQLNTAKTNKEYAALLKELQGMRTDNGLLEDQILQVLEEIDEQEQGLAQRKARLEEGQHAVEQQQRSGKETLREIEAREKELHGRREELCDDIEPHLLEDYERILRAKPDARALALVQNEACTACYMMLTKQDLNLLMMGRSIVLCRSCSRILYLAPAGDAEKVPGATE